MNEDYKKLYDAVSAKFDIGDYDSFSAKMKTPEDRKKFYDAVSSKGLDLGDYNEYESRLKKKEPTTTEQDQPQEEIITEDSSTVAEPSQESGQSIDFNQVKYGIRPTGSTEEVPVEEAPIEEAVPVEPTGVDKLQSIEQEQDALSQKVNELNLAFNNAETPEEKQDIADQYKETVGALNQLYKDKQIALAEDNTFINKDGQYVNMQAAAEAAIKNKYAFNVIPRLDATEKKPEVADKFYTPEEVIDAEESALPEFDKRIEELRDNDYFKRHIGDFIREKNKILDEKKASVRNIEQARSNNMDIMMAEFGAKYKIDDKEVSRSAFKDYLRSNEGNDRIKENGKIGLQVYNDESISDLLNFQEEASKNILGEESLRGFVATTKSFIDGIDIRLAEALIGVSIVADLDQEETENMLLKSGMRNRNLKKALENAKGKEGNFRDNFLQAYAASVKEDTEKIRGIRMLKSYDALDLLMSGDVTGFTSDIVGMSIESLPYTAMAMTGIGGTALLYNSVQANEYYDLRAQGVEKERALIASNMTATIETGDAILERMIFKNSLNSVSELVNKAGRLAGYTQKEIVSLRRNIASAFIKEYPTEFIQGSSGAIINQWALGEEIDFNKANRQGVIEGFATGPTTTVMTSPQMLQLAYAPIKKHRDMIKMESAVEDLLSASIDPENESDRSLLVNQANKIVNDIVKQKKEIEETASKVTPIQRGVLIDLTVEEMTLEAASEATGISKTSKELIDEKIKDVRERKDNLLNNVKETSPTPKAAEGGIKPETSENYANLTEDGDGNFVFYHVTNVDLEEVDPSKYGTGENRQTSREETNEVAKVGGVSMYYTSEKDGEKMVTGKNKYQVKVAKENVYDANEDPLNLKEKARELHEKEYPGKTYNGNTELAYMTKLAGEKGFEMVVGAWSGKTRAQSTQKLKPHDVQVSEGNTVKKPFEKRYKQNREKGWSPSVAVPFIKNVQPILDKITAIFNSKKDYANPLYNASAAYNYEFGEKFSKFESQEQLTELVNSSNEIPQELKDEYNNALNAGDIKGSSTREFNDNPETEPSYIENTPEGHYVNIGMVRGKDGQEMSADDIKRALPDDVTIEEETELAVGENVEEPTLSLKLSRPLTSEEILDLRNSTGQLAIPQLSNGEGIMYGTLDWGPFNSEFFVLPNKIKLSENEKEQKVGLLPEEFSELSDNDFDEQEVKDLETLTKTKRKSKYTKPSLNQKLKEKAVKAMNEMDEAQVNFKEPKGGGKKTNPLVNIGKIIKEYFGKPVKSLVMKVEDFQGIPMFLGMSDMLAAGTVKDSSGKDMNVNGGLLFGLTKGNNNLSWAGVNKNGAEEHLKRAMYLYESHKALFDRLWKEGKLPDGHIPMAIMRMSDTAVLSNEAFFRYSLNLIKSASKEKNVKSLQVFIDAAKIRVETLAKKESLNKNEKDELQSLSRVIDLGPKVKTMSGLFEYIINDAKKNEDSTWSLALKASLAKKLFGSISNKGEKNSRPWVIELFGEPSSELYLNNIYKGIGDESVIDVDPGYILGIMGVDVKNNPGVSQANHDNYGWGSNGRIIALFENLADGMDVFPEFFAKASRVFTQSSSGKIPNITSIPAQVRGSAFIDKAFVGVRISTKMSDIDIISGKIRYAFPNVQVASTQAEFDEIMSTEGVREKRDPDGNLIAGITINGKIYINPSVANLSTPIHEFGHIWMDYLRSEESGSKGTALYERGMSLVDGTIELEKAKEHYPELTLEQQKEEALVELIATRGASIIEAGKKSNFISWLNAVYEYVKSKLVKSKDLSIRNIKSLSLKQFADTALADLFGGEEINAKFNPQMEQYAMESRFSKKRAADMSMYSIIKEARLNNFSDGAIKEFLRREGYAAKDISSALEVPKSLMKSVPQSFGLIEGGMIKGIELYDRIAKGLARSESLKEMRQKAQDLLYSTDEYKKASDNLKKQMAYDLDKSLATSENKEVAKEMRDIRAELMSRKRGAKELQFIKAKLRTFIRKNIPQSLYEKKEVMDLISAVTNATPENIQAIVKDVNDLVVKHGVKTARNRIAKALNVKLNKLESGRLKGKILPEDQDLISGLISNMLTEEATPEDIENMSERLRKRYNELDSKNNLNQREYEEMILIDLALNYNNSLLMEDNDVLKLQSLEYVSSSIEDIKTGARMRMKFALTEQKEYYNQIKNEFFKDVTGLDIDFNNDQSVLNSRQEIRDRQAKVDNRPRFKKFVENFFSPVSNIVTRIEGMEGLLDKVSRMAGEMFEGKSIELILDRIDEANIDFKSGRREIMKRLDDKAKEIFGSNHRKIMIKNSKPTEFYYSNPQKVQDLVDKLIQETDPKEKKKIEKEIDSYKMPISQNEMYYIYNQAKDKANHPGFESTFGPQYESIIEHITNKLGPKVKEWADWQVDVFFPSVYEKYNAVYREIYRTDMPWNAMYAGRIHREGDADQVNLLENTNQYQTSVGGASTKVRIKNKKKIKVVDGDSNLNSYINEMEFFAHYSEPMRDITKMISNPDIRDGIIATTGEDAYKVLKVQLDKVMNRNSAKGTDIKILNFLSNAFVKAKLGLSPVIFLKQTTSALAFADYIGYRDWAKNLLSNNLASNWSELYANSVYLQDRYEQSDISKVLENYTAKNEVSFLDNVQADKVNNFLMYMIKQGDKIGIMGSIPNYIYYKEKFMARGMDEQSAIKEAVKKVERQIKTTQQSNDIQDKDFFQTSEPLYRMLNLFMSSPRALMRKEIIATRNLYRKMTGQQSKGSVKDNLRTFFTYHVAIPLFFQYVSLGFPGLLRNWRDDDKDDLIWAMILGNINAVFALGDIAVAIKDVATNKPWAGGMSQIPFFQSAQDIIDNYKRFSNASKDETKNKYFSKMIIGILEPASGIPVANIAKFGENYSKLATGDVDDFGEALLRLFNYSEYAIKGPKVKDTKSTSTSTSRTTSRSTRQTTRSSRTR